MDIVNKSVEGLLVPLNEVDEGLNCTGWVFLRACACQENATTNVKPDLLSSTCSMVLIMSFMKF
jgi:hypothetical protein